MASDNEKCAILVPVHQAIEPEVEDALLELSNRGYKVIVLRGSSAIDMARNDLADKALDGGFEETFWIDADVEFRPDDVDKIRAHGLPFIAGLYPKKGRQEFACRFWPTNEEVVFGIGGGLRSMQYVGMGFTYVRAEVYRRIASDLKLRPVKGGYTVDKKIVPYFLPMLAPDTDGDDGDLVYLAEDAALCHRARLAGFDVMADTTIRLDHWGRRKWTWEDFAPKVVYDSLKFSAVEGVPQNSESVPLAPSTNGKHWKFPHDVTGWLTEEEGTGLAKLARGKDILEVGSYCGRSAICMGQTARSLCCVDPFDCRDTPGGRNTFKEFSSNLERYGVAASVFGQTFAEADIDDRFDLIFIDGAHDEASVIADAAKASSLLAPGGLLAFHDYRVVPGHQDGGWHPGVTNTINRLIADRRAELVQTVGTVAVIRPIRAATKGTDDMSEKIYRDLYETQERVKQLEAQNAEILLELSRVVSGDVDRSRYIVNLTDGSWTRSPLGERPAAPAQINGLPKYVVAPLDDGHTAAIEALQKKVLAGEIPASIAERSALPTNGEAAAVKD